MPKKTVRIPAYRHHKGSGQAIVQIGGTRHYLGTYNSEKSQERYRRLVAQILAVSKLNRNRWEGFSRRKPHRESETRGMRGGGC